MAHYLVTGGAGFIGSNLVEALLRNGDPVRVLDDFSTGHRENLAEADGWAAEGGAAVEVVEGDIREPRVCRSAVTGIDYVLHQAAIPSVQRSVEDPVRSHGVNVDGTLNLLVAARDAGGIRRFVFASSSSLYGESEVLPKVETMVPSPISPYALQKLAAEVYCRLFHELYDLPTVALRYFNVFGPRQDPNSEYSGVIAKFVKAFRDGTDPVIYGDGEQTRDFTYVSNAVRANLLACEAGEAALGGTYNIACGARISLNGLVRMLGKLTGAPRKPEYGPPRLGDIHDSLASIDLARERLGFEPDVGIEDGLRRLVEAT